MYIYIYIYIQLYIYFFVLISGAVLLAVVCHRLDVHVCHLKHISDVLLSCPDTSPDSRTHVSGWAVRPATLRNIY